MSIENFSTDKNVVTINGRQIQDWGETDPAVTESPIDPKRVVRRGQGGSAAMLERINPGRSVVVNLNPGSADASYMQGLFNSGALIVYTRTVIGTLENVIAEQGVIVNDGPTGRAGQTITDAQYTMEFNSWTELK